MWSPGPSHGDRWWGSWVHPQGGNPSPTGHRCRCQGGAHWTPGTSNVLLGRRLHSPQPADPRRCCSSFSLAGPHEAAVVTHRAWGRQCTQPRQSQEAAWDGRVRAAGALPSLHAGRLKDRASASSPVGIPAAGCQSSTTWHLGLETLVLSHFLGRWESTSSSCTILIGNFSKEV